MNRVLFSLLSMVLALTATANDGVYFTSGNQLVPLQETDISVKKEILTISLTNNGFAKVDVYYEFYNPGNSSKSVLMGFEADPSYNDDYELHPSGIHPNIKDFTVEINGVKQSHKNAISNLDKAGLFNPLADAKTWQEGCGECDQPGHEECGDPTALYKKGDHSKQIHEYSYVYYFNATFKPGINKIHHTYKYNTSADVITSYTVPYKLSPAGRWANKQIDDFTLVIRADKTAKYFDVDMSTFPGAKFTLTEGVGKIQDGRIVLRNGAVTLHKLNFRPSPDHELDIVSADRNIGASGQFGSYYDRSSCLWLYLWWESSQSEYSELDEADKLTPEQFKRIAKNLPYANRGHVFKDPELKKYFSQLWWYMPDPSYKDDTSDFTEQDWMYVNWKEE